MLPVLHGFLVLEDARGLTTFSGDHGRGLIGAPLLVYEASYLLEHADRRDVVVLRPDWTQIDLAEVIVGQCEVLAQDRSIDLCQKSLSGFFAGRRLVLGLALSPSGA